MKVKINLKGGMRPGWIYKGRHLLGKSEPVLWIGTGVYKTGARAPECTKVIPEEKEDKNAVSDMKVLMRLLQNSDTEKIFKQLAKCLV